MLVIDLKHARLVKERFQKTWKRTNRRYFAFDTETKAKAGYPAKDALIIGRAEAAVLPIAHDTGTEFFFGHVGRAVGGAIIHHDGFEGHAGLFRQRG